MQPSPKTTRRAVRGVRAAFTLIELLVVIGIIGLLLALVFVAGNAVMRSAGAAETERLLASIGQGIEQFNTDHGYYPPLLNERFDQGAPQHERLVLADEPGASLRPFDPAFAGPTLRGETAQDLTGEDVRNFNVYSLAIYLQGVGDLNGDGRDIYNDPNTSATEPNLDDGVDGPGLRTPGPDRSWGGGRDRRSPPQGGHRPPTEGRVFGPYVNVSSSQTLERLPFEQESINVQEDRAYTGLYRFVDRWGNPIRYYRDWALRDSDGERTMRHVSIAVRDGEDVRNVVSGGYGPNFDDAMAKMIPEIIGAPYLLLSVGQDGRSGHRGAGALQTLMMDEGGRELRRVVNEVSDNVRYIP